MYRQLDADCAIETLKQLSRRIHERFPGSGLGGVADELLAAAGETRERVIWISRPHYPTRITVVLFLIVLCTAIAFTATTVLGDLQGEQLTPSVLAGLVESVTNEFLLAGAAIFFLVGIEARIKRTRAQRVLHELRAIAHVIDMHQLTKDASRVIGAAGRTTESSPKRTMTAFQLTRYLDYCSEMLSIVGKLAALYAQSLPDTVVVAAVNDIETLTTGLSRKIWQKIVQLDAWTDDQKDVVNIPRSSTGKKDV
ncbi:MAG: hypothetical protein MK110_00555 [Fuerstiella sp.]|nr:hypothetical protein [Fuerstiella sp.]